MYSPGLDDNLNNKVDVANVIGDRDIIVILDEV